MLKKSGTSLPKQKGITSIVTFFAFVFLLTPLVELAHYAFPTSFSKLITEIIPYGVLVSAVISYGLFQRKSWVIFVITIAAGICIVRDIISPSALVIKLISLTINVFLLYFFNRKDVKSLFGAKGIFFF